jgi:Peptidase family C69
LEYALGHDVHHRMPLYIYPYKKLSVSDVMHLLTSHYEGTPLDSSVDVGAGLFESPYRPRPLVWTFNGTRYHNERSIATPKTGWSFVAQIRPWLPPPLAAIVWFACDDSSTAPRVPIYASSTSVAPAYAGQGPQDGVLSPILRLDMGKAFWIQNMVSNFCYFRYKDVYPILRAKIDVIQKEFEQLLAVADERALRVYQENGAVQAVAFVTLFSVNAGSSLQSTWTNFYGELFVRFRDYYTIVPKKDESVCGCEARESGLTETMKQRIVDATGSHYEVLEDGGSVRSGESYADMLNRIGGVRMSEA